MKKVTPLISVALILAMVACHSERQEMENTARCYLEAMGNYRIDDATPYATAYTREHTLPLAKMLTERTDSAYIRSNTPADITIRGSKQLTDTSARVYFHKHTPITEQEDSLTLLLEEGKWLVDVRFRALPSILVDSVPPRIKHGSTLDQDSILLGGRYHATKDLTNGKGKLKKVKSVKPKTIDKK